MKSNFPTQIDQLIIISKIFPLTNNKHFLIITFALSLQEKCPVSSCALSSLRSEAETADLVIFKDHFTMPTFRRPKDQKWMLYLLGTIYFSIISHKHNWLHFSIQLSECPLHTQMFKYPTVFNWTATYRRDSTVVAPYERWQYYDEKVR